MSNQWYQQWVVERRAVVPPEGVTERIMSEVAQFERQRRQIWWIGWVQQIERSRTARWAACAGALAIGCLPFVYLAHVARFVTLYGE